MNWQDANQYCIDNGARLCTKGEVETGCSKNDGCDNDFVVVWTNEDYTDRKNSFLCLPHRGVSFYLDFKDFYKIMQIYNDSNF